MRRRGNERRGFTHAGHAEQDVARWTSRENELKLKVWTKTSGVIVFSRRFIEKNSPFLFLRELTREGRISVDGTLQ